MSDSFDTLQLRGVEFAKRGQFDRAAECFAHAISLEPDSPAAHNNLANALDSLGQLDDAIRHWSRAVELAPNYFHATFSLGKALQRAGQRDGALTMLDRAIELQPDHGEARFVRGLALLLLGRFREGFADYAFRPRPPRRHPQPEWDGSDQPGKTILLTAEQGYGDCIQFVRYARLVRERRACVVVECPPSLADLLRTAPGVDEVVSIDPHASQADFQIALLDLPRNLGTTLQTIPAEVPYLSPDRAKVERWSHTLASAPPGRRIGLAWAGNPDHVNDRDRSIPLQTFNPLAGVPGVTFFSLQTGPASAEVNNSPLKLIDHTLQLTDLSETAALVANLDLVITVDTAIAHLAGALGKPVWVLLQFLPDWRWMFDRTDSPWYPTARLFRQPSPGDWQRVIDTVASELTRQT